jgi:hypothetical protein
MAKYRAESLTGGAADWQTFLASHASGKPTHFTPRPTSVATYGRLYDRYRKLVALQGQLQT